jgi:hypothetical protein
LQVSDSNLRLLRCAHAAFWGNGHGNPLLPEQNSNKKWICCHTIALGNMLFFDKFQVCEPVFSASQFSGLQLKIFAETVTLNHKEWSN